MYCPVTVMIRSSYTFVWKTAFAARAIILFSPSIKFSPHWYSRYQGHQPAAGNSQLHHPPLVLQFFVPQRHLDGKQSVPIDTNKVVDGGTEEDDSHTGDKLTEVVTKCPATNTDCIERNDEHHNQGCEVYHGESR